MRKLLILFLFAAAAWGQQIQTAVPQFFGGLTAAIPATCTVKQVYFATDATAGQNWYFCTATNVWTQQLNSGAGGSPGGSTNSLQTNVSGAFSGNANDTLDTSGNISVRGTVTTDNQNPTDPGTWSPALPTVANLGSTCSGRCPWSTGSIREVSDGSTSTDCTVGGGANKVVCQSPNGTTWQPLNNAGGTTVSGYYTTIGGQTYCATPLQVCTPASGLTILNTAGSSSVKSVGGTQVLDSAATSTDNLVMAGGSISGSNTIGIAAVTCFMFQDAGSSSPRCGVFLRESSTGKLLGYACVFSQANVTFSCRIENWSNQTTLGGGLSNLTAVASSTVWVKTTCSVAGCQSGNITIQASADGLNYSQGYTEAVTAHFTTGPNQFGVIGSPDATGNDMNVPILSYHVQ